MKVGLTPTPTPVFRASAPAPRSEEPQDLSLLKCPYLKAHPEARPLAYKHEYEATKNFDPPVPQVKPGGWAEAKHYNVVIAGGGIGGLYTAWRLQGCDGSSPAGKSIGIFERTAHLGGRLHTAKVASVAHPMDVGAMRYVPSQNPLLQHLTDHFHIDTRTFVVTGDQNLNFIRGQRVTHQEATADPSKLPYQLAPEEAGKSPDELMKRAFAAVIPNYEKLTQEELKSAVAPLQGLGLHDVLKKTLSQEAIQMLTDASGYESDLQNWDAGEAILELSKGDVTYAVPKEGMSAFYEGIQCDLSRTKTDIKETKTLRSVDYDQATKQFKLIFEDSGGAIPVTADELVLNMPQVPLKQLVEDSPFLQHTALEENLDKVKPNPLTRIFATYEKPWWNEMGIEGGRSVSDTNLGQVYYYNAGPDDKFKRPYVEVYNDGHKSEFWETLQNPEEPGVAVRLEAKPQLAAELQKELEEMHGRELPAPTGLLYKRWSDPFFGAGWHTWNPGSTPQATSEKMTAPLPGLPLYVCGEAFSTAQGWVEGALQTSERVLEKMGKAPAPR